jgi:hypothetical protein
MNTSVCVVHLQWDGPFTWSEKNALNGPSDYGVYQVYGCHSVYGVDTLLYIGKASDQTFAKRLGQEDYWMYHQDFRRLSVYVGRCSGWVAHARTKFGLIRSTVLRSCSSSHTGQRGMRGRRLTGMIHAYRSSTF